MGRVKAFIEEHGFYPMDEIYVCSGCFEDYGLRKYIIGHAEYDECSYCGKRAKEKIAIHIDELLIYFLECISEEWGDPASEGVGWESREGGWVSAKVIDSYDLIMDELDLGIRHEKLAKDIIGALADKEWCQKNPHSLLMDDDLKFSWKRFSHQIKHEIRFVFYKANTYDEYAHDSEIIKEPHEIMERLGIFARELNLLGKIPQNTTIYRARPSTKGERFIDVTELGPPLAHEAKYSNRMSPAGIAMFYGALEEDTAIAETIDPDKDDLTIISLASFSALDDLKILDLTNIPSTPSLFDEEMRGQKMMLSFLNAFLTDFTKPVKKNNRENIEYIPTQVITEYFKYIFWNDDQAPIQGILYPSSRRINGKACVLFIEQRNCVGGDSNSLYRDKQWLLLDKAKTKYIEINSQ